MKIDEERRNEERKDCARMICRDEKKLKQELYQEYKSMIGSLQK